MRSGKGRPREERGSEVMHCVSVMKMYDFLICCAGQKKILKTENVDNIYEQVTELFNVSDDCSIRLQQWNEEWNDFVDVDDLSKLSERAKLAVVIINDVKLSSFGVAAPGVYRIVTI